MLLSPTVTSNDSCGCCRFACWCRLRRQCGLQPLSRIRIYCGWKQFPCDQQYLGVGRSRSRPLRRPPHPSRPLWRPLPPSLRPCVWPLLLTWVWRVEIVDMSDCICSIILWFCWVELAMSLSCCCICCSAMVSAFISLGISMCAQSVDNLVDDGGCVCPWKLRESVVTVG